MHALIFTHSSHGAADHPIAGPQVLYPLVDRPFLQHLIEWLVQQGITTIDLILTEPPEPIEALVGDGTRWGVDITCHLVPPGCSPYQASSLVVGPGDESPRLVIHGDILAAPELADLSSSPGEILFYLSTEASQAHWWTGWAWLQPATIRRLATELGTDATLNDLEHLLRHQGPQEPGPPTETQMLTAPVLRASPEYILESQRRLLTRQSPPDGDRLLSTLLHTGQQISPGLWSGHQVIIEEGVTIEPPVFIGPQSQIKSGAHLGPNTVLQSRCLIDGDTEIANSLICENTYIGPHSRIDSSIITPESIWTITGPSDEQRRPSTPLVRPIKEETLDDLLIDFGGRAVALALFVLALPIMGTIYLKNRLTAQAGLIRSPLAMTAANRPRETEHTWNQRSMCSLARPDSIGGPWSYLLHYLLPGLWLVAKADLKWVGVSPRSPQELEELPDHWQSMLRKAPMGLISEAATIDAFPGDDDGRLAADIYQVAMASRPYHLRLLARYLRSLVPLPTDLMTHQKGSQ